MYLLNIYYSLSNFLKAGHTVFFVVVVVFLNGEGPCLHEAYIMKAGIKNEIS